MPSKLVHALIIAILASYRRVLKRVKKQNRQAKSDAHTSIAFCVDQGGENVWLGGSASGFAAVLFDGADAIFD